MRRIYPVIIAVMLAGTAVADSNKADLKRGLELAETLCVACHDVDGNSAIPMYPKIAGQHEAYLDVQIIAIRDGVRDWGLAAAMQPIVEEMTDEEIRDVSAHYAKQLAKAGEADPNLNIELGQQIYRGGLRAKNIPACMACHGPSGQGIPGASQAKDGIVAFPRLTGQHKEYIISQMEAFKDGDRQHHMMDSIAERLSEDEIEAVANFIQGLR